MHLRLGLVMAIVLFATVLVHEERVYAQTCHDLFSNRTTTSLADQNEPALDLLLGEKSPERDAIIEESEAAAFTAISNSLISGEKAQREVEGWFNTIRSDWRLNGSLSVFEYTALVQVLRTDFFADYPDQTLVSDMETTLVTSWTRLTGRRDSLETILNSRLPDRVLRRATNEEVQFHLAVFNEQNPTAKSKAPALRPVRNYVFRVRDAVFGIALVGIAFSHTGSHILSGAVTGALIGAVAENMIHNFLAHPSAKLRKRFDQMGWLGKIFNLIAYSHHNIHHGQLRDYYDLNSIDRAKVDARIRRDGIDLPTALLHEREYGLKIERMAALQMMATVLPFTAATSYVLGFDALSTTTALATSVAFIPHVNLVHRYLHMTRDDAMASAGPLMRWFLNTRYFAFIARQHYVHHSAPNRNFNVTPGLDGLFGTLRDITLRDLVEMKQAGGIF